MERRSAPSPSRWVAKLWRSACGDTAGTRLNRLWKDVVKDPDIENELRPLLARYAKERNNGERFGDWVERLLWKERAVIDN